MGSILFIVKTNNSGKISLSVFMDKLAWKILKLSMKRVFMDKQSPENPQTVHETGIHGQTSLENPKNCP